MNIYEICNENYIVYDKISEEIKNLIISHLNEKKREIVSIWEEFSDIPVNDDGNIEEEFLDFPIGTHVEDIWHWIEEEYPVRVYDLLYHFDDFKNSIEPVEKRISNLDILENCLDKATEELSVLEKSNRYVLLGYKENDNIILYYFDADHIYSVNIKTKIDKELNFQRIASYMKEAPEINEKETLWMESKDEKGNPVKRLLYCGDHAFSKFMYLKTKNPLIHFTFLKEEIDFSDEIMKNLQNFNEYCIEIFSEKLYLKKSGKNIILDLVNGEQIMGTGCCSYEKEDIKNALSYILTVILG